MTSRFKNLLWLGAIIAASVAGVWLLRWALTEAVIETAGEDAIRPIGAPDNIPVVQRSEGKVLRELTNIISAQLTAIRSNDFARAYSYASGLIQSRYPLTTFERMVRQGYPALASSTDQKFIAAGDNGREAVVGVLIYNQKHELSRFEYYMLREGEGWKVSGVMEVPPPRPPNGSVPKKI